MKILGLILLIIGIIGLAYFGYEATQQSESFSVFGADVTVTTANWTPVIISGVVLVIGLFLTIANRGKKA